MKSEKRIICDSSVLGSPAVRNAIIPVKAKPPSTEHIVLIVPRKEILL